jgi:hypothetical protein
MRQLKRALDEEKISISDKVDSCCEYFVTDL